MGTDSGSPPRRTPEEMLDLPREEFLGSWYANHYAATSYGGAQGRVQNWMHSSLERSLGHSTHFPNVLEVGGNVGEHLRYVRHSFSRYVLSDLVDRRSYEDRQRLARRNVEFVQASAEALPFASAVLDRALMTCVLHHLVDPEEALTEIRRVVRPGGVIDLFLPSDPGMAFRLAKRIGPLRQASRQGLGEVKALVDARDHRNHVAGLMTLTRHTFRKDAVAARSYPVRGLTLDLSLWTCIRVVRHE